MTLWARASVEIKLGLPLNTTRMATSTSSGSIFDINPYEGHPNLTEREAEVLWEYAKLSQNVKEVRRIVSHRKRVLITMSVSVDCRNASVERGTR